MSNEVWYDHPDAPWASDEKETVSGPIPIILEGEGGSYKHEGEPVNGAAVVLLVVFAVALGLTLAAVWVLS